MFIPYSRRQYRQTVCIARIRSAAIVLALLASSVAWADGGHQRHLGRGVEPSPFDVLPGNDYWITLSAEVTFGAPDYPAIPADFFHPGSEPFEGHVRLSGLADGPPELGDADTVVRRTAPALLPGEGSAMTVPIELVELNLRSTEPILVGTQPYDVFVEVSPTQPGLGDMTIVRVDDQGGTFEWHVSVAPVYIFVPVLGGPPRTLSTHPPLVFGNDAPGAWSYLPPAPPLPGSGPNFYPLTPQELRWPEIYHQTIVPPWVEACCLPSGDCISTHLLACALQNGQPGGIGTSCAGDADGDGVDDTCARDCNSNGVEDHADIAAGTALDLNSNGIPDSCDIAECRNNDLNHNGIIDEADVAAGTAADANSNGLIDEVEQPATQQSYISMQGPRLSDAKLARKLRDLLVNSNGTPNARDVKLFFQQCYGGGMLDDIERELGGSVPWVAGSASRHDEVSFGEPDSNVDSNGPLDRWTRPLIDALHDLPVLRALKRAALEDQAAPMNRRGQNERPQYRFSGDEARPVTLADPGAGSHHAVILAGKPDRQRHRNDVRGMCALLAQEWGDLNTTGTSVHVLFGDGMDNPCADSGVPAANVSSATTAGFCAVLDALRPLLNANEEFVLYVSDHGTASSRAVNRSRLRGVPGLLEYDLDIPEGYRYGLIRDPFNVGPTLELIANGAYPAGALPVFLNGALLGHLDPAALDPAGRNLTVLPIPEGAIVAGTNLVVIDVSAGAGVTAVSAELQLNDVNTIPVPGWGDMDSDADVDLIDQAGFVGCLSGPGGGYAAQDCANADIDGDEDVDLQDARLLQTVFTGPR